MNIRNRTSLVGIFPVISSIGSSGRSSFSLRLAEFAGRFTLPFEAAWGEMVLPEGEYALHYGAVGEGIQCVEIFGVKPGGPRGIYFVREQGVASVVQNAFICTHKHGRHIIRALELPVIGKSVSFVGPNASKLMDNPNSSADPREPGAQL
ncbi:MAG: hypothetical protein EPN47_10085 [Acidobacteria bacterium]|nr:MAG: hypothetical protein EPN47_10085 [Acidobacteriota bacterium]